MPTTSGRALARNSPLPRKTKRNQQHKQPQQQQQKKKGLLHRPAMQSNATRSVTDSQRAVRKLLRSIKRREDMHVTPRNALRKQTGKALKRKLNFGQNRTLTSNLSRTTPSNQKTKRQKLHNNTTSVRSELEEGEIRTDMEDSDVSLVTAGSPAFSRTSKGRASQKSVVSRSEVVELNENDDDCICLGSPEPASIIILDDETLNESVNETAKNAIKECIRNNLIIVEDADAAKEVSSPAPNPPPSESNRYKPLITSTPCQKRSDATAAATAHSSTMIGTNAQVAVVLPFFVDKTPMPWYESIRSNDTFDNYTMNPGQQKNVTPRGGGRNQSRNATPQALSMISPNAVITLNDTTIMPADEAPSTLKSANSTPSSAQQLMRKRKSTSLDDSVIFVDETRPSPKPTEDFIRLTDYKAPNAFVTPPRNKPPPTALSRHSLFSASERKQLQVYNNNAYNPTAGIAGPRPTKRMIIIDGSNVAYAHVHNNFFSVKGLEICLEYFKNMGHEVKAVVPQSRLQYSKSSDPPTLERLNSQGFIVFTPCKNLPGKSSMSYDDRFILQLACELDAAVVSNDNYRDLLNENAAFKKIIENRVIGYTWCNDIFILPKDPYGRWGPTLDNILNRKS